MQPVFNIQQVISFCMLKTRIVCEIFVHISILNSEMIGFKTTGPSQKFYSTHRLKEVRENPDWLINSDKLVFEGEGLACVQVEEGKPSSWAKPTKDVDEFFIKEGNEVTEEEWSLNTTCFTTTILHKANSILELAGLHSITISLLLSSRKPTLNLAMLLTY